LEVELDIAELRRYASIPGNVTCAPILTIMSKASV